MGLQGSPRPQSYLKGPAVLSSPPLREEGGARGLDGQTALGDYCCMGQTLLRASPAGTLIFQRSRPSHWLLMPSLWDLRSPGLIKRKAIWTREAAKAGKRVDWFRQPDSLDCSPYSHALPQESTLRLGPFLGSSFSHGKPSSILHCWS